MAEPNNSYEGHMATKFSEGLNMQMNGIIYHLLIAAILHHQFETQYICVGYPGPRKRRALPRQRQQSFECYTDSSRLSGPTLYRYCFPFHLEKSYFLIFVAA